MARMIRVLLLGIIVCGVKGIQQLIMFCFVLFEFDDFLLAGYCSDWHEVCCEWVAGGSLQRWRDLVVFSDFPERDLLFRASPWVSVCRVGSGRYVES